MPGNVNAARGRTRHYPHYMVMCERFIVLWQTVPTGAL